MKLIIMRHGEAEAYQSDDKARKLTRFGRSQAEFAGRRLAEFMQSGTEKPHVDLAYVSPYVRTQQTYESLRLKIAVNKKLDCDLITPDSDPSAFTDYLHGMSLSEEMPASMILISHMPFVSLLADKLCHGFNARIFATADILIVDYDETLQSGSQAALLQSIS